MCTVPLQGESGINTKRPVTPCGMHVCVIVRGTVSDATCANSDIVFAATATANPLSQAASAVAAGSERDGTTVTVCV